MGKITKDELSSSLNDHIDNQGNDKQDEIDSNLQTSDKTIVGAINELYQNINDGKALIANAIGEPLTDEDSFTTMSNGIKSLTSLLKTNLTNAGVDVNDEEKLKSLISKVKGIIKENTSKGIKFAEGTGSWTVSSSVTISSPDLDFIPDIIICHFESLTQTRYYYGNYTAENTTSYRTYITNDSPLINTYNSASKLYISDIGLGSFKLKMDSVNENNSYGNYWYISGKCIGWYAIKLGEEENKGIQYASGNVSAESDSKNFNEPYGNMSSGYVKIPKPSFEPSVIMVMGTATDSSTKAPFTPTSILSYDPAFKKSMVKVGSFGNGQNSQLYYDHIIADSLVVGSDYYYIPISYAYSQTGYDWFAFGAGEEDTTSAPLQISIQTKLPNSGVENEFVIIHDNTDTEIVFYDINTTSESDLPEECIVICVPYDCTMLETKYGILPFNISLGEIYYKKGTAYKELEIYNYKNGVWQLYSNDIIISKFVTNHPYTYSKVEASSITVNDKSVFTQSSSNGAGLWTVGTRISGLPAGKYKFIAECMVHTNSTVAGNIYISEYQSKTSIPYNHTNQNNLTLVLDKIESSTDFSLTVYVAGGTANVTGLTITNAKLIRLYD